MSKTNSNTVWGVKCFSVAGRMNDRRLRCLGMTEEERRWRAQFLKDQILSPEEPKFVPEYYKDITNCFRRLWKTPFNNLENNLKASLGHDAAFILRHSIGKGICIILATYVGVYYFKYHTDNFTKYRSFEVYYPRGRMYPTDPGYPNYPVKTVEEYYDQGFYSSVLAKKV